MSDRPPRPDPVQRQARALGDPTRHEIFRVVAGADRPIGVAELTDRLGINHNAVRQHLAKLVDADLLVESVSAPSGRGRPRLQYTVDPTADSRWGAVGPYERLALLLTEILRSGDAPVEVGRRAGRRERLGRRVGGDAGAEAVDADPVALLVERMARHGFEPELAATVDGVVDVVLGRCPYESAALADPDTVCQLHLGLAYGFADDLDGLEIDELVPRDPRRAGCRLRGHVATPGRDA